MTDSVRFNYIITIYNKESMIREVLQHVIHCCGSNSYIYPVLDGCTDDSEKIIDEVQESNRGAKIKKVYTSDVHELLSINAGLKEASQIGEGFNIILQDDVLIEDVNIEQKIKQLYYSEGNKLGYVSFRLGANLAADALSSRDPVPYVDYVENAFGHGIDQAKMLPIGSVAYRSIPIKSPVCIPFKVIRDVGMYNEKLAPYGHDDIDFALRVIKKGYYNIVYAVKFSSELEWGGTRQQGHLVVDSVIERNMDYIRAVFPEEIRALCSSTQPMMVKEFEQNPIVSKEHCEKIWVKKTSRLNVIRGFFKPAYPKYKAVKKMLTKHIDLREMAKFNSKYDGEYTFSDAVDQFKTRDEIYNYFHHYYYHGLPELLREHRKYIESNSKGFGEVAFHAMWWKLVQEFNPVNVLEIGVYRGQVISLWALISKLTNTKVFVSGVSPFSPAGDTVSKYLVELDYIKDVRRTFYDLNLPEPTLIKGFSKDKAAVEYIESKAWDMIYIDGGHDYEDVLFDYKMCLQNLSQGGLIIFDDASLYTDYNPLSFSFGGHPGPSLVAREFADSEMEFIGAVGHNNVYRKR